MLILKVLTKLMMVMKNKRLIIIFSIVAFLLLIPLVAMIFTNTVRWNVADFALAAVILTGAGLAVDFAVVRIKNIEYRVALIFVILLITVLVWLEIAVGIFVK